MRFRHAKNPLSNLGLACSSIPKLLPVIEPPASDYVVDRCECPVRMIQMTVPHAGRL
ncbi:MAG TPA: hypothetical protein VFZ22_14135 [Pyrinomonadaceae bacterium]|nr:hypothetical protein [Pyrinomonadaceae bacterium]